MDCRLWWSCSLSIAGLMGGLLWFVAPAVVNWFGSSPSAVRRVQVGPGMWRITYSTESSQKRFESGAAVWRYMFSRRNTGTFIAAPPGLKDHGATRLFLQGNFVNDCDRTYERAWQWVDDRMVQGV